MIGRVFAALIAHEWKPTLRPHPGLLGDTWVRSNCGRIERRSDVFQDESSILRRCKICFKPDAPNR